MLVPNGALILVVDGVHRALYRNDAEARAQRLIRIDALHQSTPRSSEIGSDHAGRHFESASSRRGSYEETDLHQRNENVLAYEAADVLNDLACKGTSRLILVADPHVLGTMRPLFSAATRAALMQEIAKNCAQQSESELAALLAKCEP